MSTVEYNNLELAKAYLDHVPEPGSDDSAAERGAAYVGLGTLAALIAIVERLDNLLDALTVTAVEDDE